MQNITVKELLSAVHGTLLSGSEDAVVGAINTDSRKASVGEVVLGL